MNETIFTVRNLTKKYKHFTALNSVNIEIRRGDIYGFVGENGAGKTTLIRIMAGLVSQTDGEIALFGATAPDQLSRQRRRIGGIVENPVIYPDLNAVENLEISRLQRGISDKDCIRKALKTVNLTDTGEKKAKNFSLGMRQRLGLATALLGNPEFIVLDEPVNGLDPAGIVELRKLLKRLNREYGITILISSHILGELYQLATCYGFIHQGKMMEQISVDDLNKKCKKHLYIKVDNGAKASTVLETALSTRNFEILPHNVIRLYEYLDQSGKVSSVLFAGGLTIEELTIKGDDLEGYYMSLIGGNR